MNLGYMGKPYDSNTGLYNYGYRDYKPEAARFTTVDPIRDGSNWFVYVNSDPVNYVDKWGLESKEQRTEIYDAIPAAYNLDSKQLSDLDAQDKINDLGTGKVDQFSPNNVVDNSQGWQYVGDKSQTGNQYESTVKSLNNSEDIDVDVYKNDYTYQTPNSNPTAPSHIGSSEGYEYSATNKDTGYSYGNFHDVNNDGWIDYSQPPTK